MHLTKTAKQTTRTADIYIAKTAECENKLDMILALIMQNDKNRYASIKKSRDRSNMKARRCILMGSKERITMTYQLLVDFPVTKMKLSHIYQPHLIRSSVGAGGSASLRQLATFFLSQDDSQLLFSLNTKQNLNLLREVHSLT